eukprot:Pgem_evm1s3609
MFSFLFLFLIANNVLSGLADNPVSGSPKLIRPKGVHCKVQIFRNISFVGAAYTHYDFYPPNEDKCPQNKWNLIVLDWSANVKGVQFDRFGLIGIGNSELFRFTTPEPTQNGIEWTAEADVSEYHSLFTNKNRIYAWLPNYVTKVYTGVIYGSVSITFYNIPEQSWVVEKDIILAPPTILPLYPLTEKKSNITALKPHYYNNKHDKAGSFNTFQQERMRQFQKSSQLLLREKNDNNNNNNNNNISPQINANLNTVYEKTVIFPEKMVKLIVNVHTSGHGCEEFWYTLVSSKYDHTNCAGGAFREILISVDDEIVASHVPFEVVYCYYLWICPGLWRPVTGLRSFHIPPFKFDLTGVLGKLSDGKKHTIQIQVNNGENLSQYPKVKQQGSWILNADLLVYQNKAAKVISAVQIMHRVSDLNFEVKKRKTTGKNSDPAIIYSTTATRKIHSITLLSKHLPHVTDKPISNSFHEIDHEINIDNQNRFLLTMSDSNSTNYVSGTQNEFTYTGKQFCNGNILITKHNFPNAKFQGNISQLAGYKDKILGVCDSQPPLFEYLHNVFPYNIYTQMLQTPNSFSIDAYIRYGIKEESGHSVFGDAFINKVYNDHIESSGYLARGLGKDVLNGKATQYTTVDVNNQNCYFNMYQSLNGKITKHLNNVTCDYS